MKRNKIVKLIKEYIYGPSNYPEHLNMADGLLRQLEKVGMRPPVEGDIKSQLDAVHFNKWENDET